MLAAQNLVSFFQRLCLTGPAQLWEPKKLRYRLFHVGSRLVRSGRQLILRLHRRWPWTAQLYDAFGRLYKLPAPA